MTKEAKCGEVVHEHNNYDDDKAHVELTIESLTSTCGESEGGTEPKNGLKIEICDKKGTVIETRFKNKFPAGPDRYQVPGDGKLQIVCPKKGDGAGTCKVTWTLRWIS